MKPPKRDLPAWRSLLYIPTINDKFIAAAHTRGADAIILDLEDSIPPARKEEARERVAAAAEKVAATGMEVLVRVNSPWRLAIRDVEAAVGPKVSALILPKVESAQHVQIISEVVAEMEELRGMTVGSTKFIVLIETAEAYGRMEDIANADIRVIAMSLGTEDFSASCGMQADADALYVPKVQMLICAKAAGIIPLGFIHTVADFKDTEGLRNACIRARRLGFMASTCIHPAQVAIVNEAYAPTAEEVDHARRVLEAARKAEAEGLGAYTVDGKMVDKPIVDRAHNTMNRFNAIEAIQARLKKA